MKEDPTEATFRNGDAPAAMIMIGANAAGLLGAPSSSSSSANESDTDSHRPPRSSSATAEVAAVVELAIPIDEANAPHPPPHPLPEPPDRALTERAKAALEAASRAPPVGSSDSVLSRTSSEEHDDNSNDDEEYDDDGGYPCGQGGDGGGAPRGPGSGGHRHDDDRPGRRRRRKARESSFLYMQSASVEVDLLNLSGDEGGDGEGGAESDRGAAHDSLGSSWSQVFHESRTGNFSTVGASSERTSSSIPSNPQKQRGSSSRSSSASAAAAPNPAPQKGGRRSSSLRAAAPPGRTSFRPRQRTALEVLRRYEILVEGDAGTPKSPEESDQEPEAQERQEPFLLRRLLEGFAASYRHDLSALEATIRASYPGFFLDPLPQPARATPVQDKTKKPSPPPGEAGDCMVVRFLTAGYPKEPALLECPPRFAGALVGCVVSVLTRSHESDSGCSSSVPGPGTTTGEEVKTAAEEAAATLPIRLDSRVLYSSARFQSHRLWKPARPSDERPALALVWDLWRRSMAPSSSSALRQHQHRPPRDGDDLLREPLGQLAAVLGVAGVTPRILREMLALAASPGAASIEDRWALIRALTLVADGANSSFSGGRSEPVLLYGGDASDAGRLAPSDDEATAPTSAAPRPRARSYSGSHDLVVVTSPPGGANQAPSPSSFTPDHFFIWTGRPEGWKRKITGLSSWPFRNDFGAALWFRADHLDPSRYPVLLSYRAETAASESSGGEGGGVDVSLVPLGRGTGTDACTIQVSVYDYDRHVPAQTLHVPGCVLLGSVWYHLAVRHSNARLKGVFSLSSRQQVTVLVNGKVVLHQPLVFPRISASDTIQGESALLPAMVRAAAIAAARRPSVTGGGGGMYSCTWTLCSDFEGETSSVLVFNDNVSDAALRALYQATGGTDPGHTSKKPARSLSSDKERWDSRKSDIVKKSRVLDANLMSDDADEVVLSQRRATVLARQKRNASVIDVVVTGSGSAIEDDAPSGTIQTQFGDDFTGNGDLLKPASFGSKVFLAWDPKRAIDDLAVEVHVGAHLSLGHDSYRWSVAGPQDVIGSLGGVQSLVILFRSILEGETISSNGLTYLLLLLRSFVQNRDENSREFLRCGGIDVIEQLIYKAGAKLLKFIQTQDGPAGELVMALMRLRSSCDHYVGLETKVFSRLVFNLPLWLGACYGDSLHALYLPVLSAITRANPDKVRDCVGARDMIQVALSLRPRFESSDELQTGVDFLVGMVFEVLSCGTTHQDMSPLLCGIAVILESSDASQGTVDQRLLAFKLCSVLLLLLQIRPPIAGLYESFSHCCGSLQSAVGWLLCSMVKSFDEQLRSIGIRCVAEYLDVASNGADYPLTLGSHSVINVDSSEAVTGGDGNSSVSRFGRLAKGFVVMTPANKSTVISPSRQTPRVVIKLLWHLLKSHRASIGEATQSALLSWIVDDGGSSSLASLDYVRSHAITKTATRQPGWRLNMEWVDKVLVESSSIVGRSLRNPLALAAIVRLIRYLNDDVQDRWLMDLLTLARANRKSMSLLSSVLDWQPCLFHLVSETLENLRNVCFKSSKERGRAMSDDPNLLAATEDHQPSSSMLSVGRRLDLCVELFSTLLGHLVRDGGDKSLDAVEKAVSLQRICVNGHDVVFLILSGLCENLFDYGTILDIGSISAQDWKDVDFDNDSLPLKQSARLVTDAILSNGTKGLDMPSAVKSWRSLRHLAAVVAALCADSSFGVVDLFDYNHRQAAAIDKVSGGLHGIRLPDGRVARITYSTFLNYVKAMGQSTDTTTDQESVFRRDMDRRFCTHLASQVFSLLDAFIFPESLDEVLPASQLHSLALVRHSEPRLGPSQGPLVASAMRLSSVLLALLEPGSVKLLQCASRMRCLVSWALEMERERLTSDARAKISESGVDLLDQLLIGTLMHCHRALGRCSSLLSEIESTSFEKYFDRRDSHKKHHRRLLRTALEIRDVVLLIFRGCQDLLMSSLSNDAFDALRSSLEGSFHQRISKESVAKDFLASNWVTGFQDVETRRDIAIPEQLSMGNIPLSSEQAQGSNGIVLVEKLAQESKAIALELEKTLDGWFEDYLETTRLWAETDAVRDLEYDGDSAAKRLAEKYNSDYGDMSRGILLRRNAAESRSRRILQMTVDPWDNARYWKLANHTDRTGARVLLVPNRKFTDHKDASYELMMEKEREKAEKERRSRLRDNEMSEVMRRNAEAFATHDSIVTNDGDVLKDDDSSAVQVSDGESSEVGSSSGVHSIESLGQDQHAVEEEREEDWDRIETDEYLHADIDGDIDGWARLFIWADGESVVARFENVIIVSLYSYVEGKILLTTHGLYFQQTGDETSVITKCPIDGQDAMNSDSKHRRWRVTRLIEIHGRRYLLRQQALELFFADGQQLFLNFPGGPKERDRFYAKLRNSCKTPMLGSLKSLNPRTVFRKTRLSELWQQRRISNFDYLMAINRMAGRSFNDITQYPVFPWVLSDYTSETIDLNDTGVFRDLSKPIGALNADRLAQLLERFRDLELFGFSEAERFLYGSHYSSPGIVLHYLIRQEPFTTMAIELQSGRFDCPDRLFFDIAGSWNGCLSSSSDMKELIPEFYSLPEMFLNTNKFPLGRTQGGRPVDDVSLPPWAKGSAYEFVRIHRLALESEYVSQNLHSWIDLIFGFKQRGPEAEASHNLFHHLSYEGAVDLDKIADDVDRRAAESHIQNFGQTPSQLIASDPHPCRLPASECWKPLIYNRSVPRNLRCYTPSKQFGNKGGELANGAVLKISVLSETLLVVYSDMSIGTYRWYPNNRTNRLRMDKLRPMPRRELSTSRSAIKRGSTIPAATFDQSGICVGNWSFAVTIGGYAKEELRRKAILPSSTRLMAGNEMTLASAEMSGYLVSCGFWDDTINVHSIEPHRLLASESGGHRGMIRCFAEDDGLLVTGGEDATCRVWVLGHPDMAIALADGYVQTSLGVSNDGDQVLSCCHVLWGHDAPVTALGLDSALDVVASGNQSGLVCIHTIRRGEFVRSFRVPSSSESDKECSGAVRKIALDSIGNMVIHMSDYGLHTFTANAVLLKSTNAGELIVDMTICSRGEILISGGMNCQVMIRSVHDLQVLSLLDLTRHGPIRCISLTPDDLNPTKQFLFVGSDDGMITIVDEDPAFARNFLSFF